MEISDVMYVRKWGGSTADGILDPASYIFRVPEIDGLIGYRWENGCAIVFGDPICSPAQIKNLIHAFHEFCEKEGLRIVYLVISEWFATWLFKNGYCKTIIEYGEELVLDPHNDPRKKKGTNARLVRRKVNHALNEGVVVKEYIPFDDQIEKEISQVGEKWLKARKGPQIYFSKVHLLEHRDGKRWFYAEKNGQMVGIVILSRLDKHQGWLLNNLMFTPEASNGVPELLVVTALDVLSQEGCRYVTFGTVPANQLGEIVGPKAFFTYLAKGVYNLANKIFHLHGKKKFWEKFDPVSEKSFLAFKGSYIGLKEIIALKKALNATLKN